MKLNFRRLLAMFLSIMMVVGMLPTMVFATEATETLTESNYVAQIGDKKFETLAAAFEAAQDGNEIRIRVAGEYSLSGISGKNITVTGTIDGVVFDNIGAFNMGSANVTFNNVTFDYYPNVNYTGLQHSGNLVYNNCIINGQVFLYGASETFNDCTFNQTSADAYNVWTYGAKEVEFNGCIFNSAGKSVLVYNEAGPATELKVIDTDFIASSPVSEKAAIEIDTSAPNNPGAMDGTVITIDAETTATGFATDTKSGNSLWNDKKVVDGQPNGGTTSVVVVDGETVKDSVDNAPAVTYVAQIGEKKYETLAEAVAEIGSGDVVIDLLADATLDITAWQNLPIGGDTTTSITINGNGKTLTFNHLNSDWNNVATNNNAKLILNDMTITNSGYNNGPWNRHDINFACDVELNNVNSDKALAFKAGATLNNVTISDANTSDTYAIWIQPNGQTVTITNSTIDMLACSDGRGIKIDNQYRNEGQDDKVTLNVSNTSFKTDEKAAIMVKSAVGADIILTNVDICGVAADTVNAVWNDEDAKAYKDLISVTGGKMFQEGAEAGGLSGTGTETDPFLIDDINDLKWFRDDVNAGNNYSGKYVKLNADINLAGENWTPIGNDTNRFQGTFDGNDKTISNLVITGNTSDVGFFGVTTNGEIKNLTINNAKVSGYLNVAVVAGTPYTSKYTKINVTGHVEVNGFAYVGGVGGKNAYANWTNITVNVDDTSYVKATSTDANGNAYRTYVGGVVGFNGEGGHTFKNITSNIDVIGDVCDIGGIFGIAHYGNNFENITCTGDVTNTIGIHNDGDDAATDVLETGLIAGVWHNRAGNTVTFTNISATGTIKTPNVQGVTFVNGGLIGNAYSASNNTAENSGSLIIDGKEAWLVVPPKGNVPYAYTSATTIWGETWTNSKVSYVIKVVDANGNVMGTSTLNPALYTFTGNTNVAWHITLPGITDNDEWWIQEWTTAPSLTNAPAKVELWADGVKVNEGNIQFNEPDNLNTIYAAVAGADGKILSYYTSVSAAGAVATSGQTVQLLRDTTETVELAAGVTLDKNGFTADGVTVATPIYVAQIGETTYTSLQAAIDAAAQTGDVITVITDHEIDSSVTVESGVTGDKYAVLINASGKKVIIDLAGHKLTVNVGATKLFGIFAADNGGEITLTDSSVEQTGAVNVTTGTNYLYSVFFIYDNTAKINIAGGSYTADAVKDSLIYSQHNEIVTINGGTFTLHNLNNANGPWIVNVKGAGDGHVTVTGGTFSTDINCQKWSNEVLVPETHYTVANADGTYTVKEGAVAYVNTGMTTGPYYAPKNIGYATIDEAFAAAVTKKDSPITLLANVKLSKNVEISNVGKTIVLVCGEFAFDCNDYGIILTDVAATLTAPAGLNVITTVAGYKVEYTEGTYTLVVADPAEGKVAKIGDTYFATLAEALNAAADGATIELIWAEGDAAIAMNGAVYGKTVTITGTAIVDWSKDNLFVGRGGEGNGTVIFDNAKLTSASNSSSYGIHVSGREKDTDNKYDGTLIIKNSTIELDYLINRNNIEVDNSTFTVKNGFGIAGRPASETESGTAATATIDIKNGSTVKVLNHNGMGVGRAATAVEGYGILNLTNSTFESTSFNVDSDQGTFNVYGESTVKINKLTGKTIRFQNGAIVKDSTVGGGVFVAGKVTFRGDNKFGMLSDFGTLRGYYGTTADMEWSVEAGASVTLTDKDRYGLGYGDKVTISGSLTDDALTARDTLDEDDIAVFMHGLVAQESSGWNQSSSLTVKDAYVVLGSNNSFGNKPGNYGGTYKFAFDNVVLDSSRITFYEANSKTEFTFNMSDVKVGTFMTRDPDSVFTLTDTKLVSTTTTNGTDEGNYHAGTLVLTNSSLTYSAPLVMENGTLTLGAGSRLSAPSITGAGTIVIDATDMMAGTVATITANASEFTGTIKVINNDKLTAKIDENGNIVLVEVKTYVAKIGEEKFETVAAALAYAKEQGMTDVEITLIGETESNTTDSFDLLYTTLFNSVTIKQEDPTKTYYLYKLYTGVRTNGGKFIFDGVNITVTEQYMFQGNVELINNSKITSKAEANCFFYYADVIVNGGSSIKGVIEDIRGGTLTIDGGKTDGTYAETPGLQDAILAVNWADSELVLKNGAYVKINSANEVGRLTVNGTLDISDSKLDSYQWIAVNAGATLTVNGNSTITTKEITGTGKIIIDATGMTAGKVEAISANASGFTGTIEVINNDKLTAAIDDNGDIVLVAKEAELFDIAKTNMIMGQNLALMFAFEKSNIADADLSGYVAKVSIAYKDDRGTVNSEIVSSNWTTVTIGGVDYWCVTVSNLAAKEMDDDVTVTIYKGEEAISKAKTMSLRQYGEERLAASTDNLFKTTVVDMLNYGAEAQKYFEYNENNLANRNISAYQNLATTTVTLDKTRNIISDENNHFIASNVTFTSDIAMLFAIARESTAVSGKITFVNHKNGTVTTFVDSYEEIIANGKAAKKFVFTGMVVADIDQVISVEFYDAEGNVVISLTDSLDAYLGRVGSTSRMKALADAFGKFSTSAYAYLHK